MDNEGIFSFNFSLNMQGCRSYIFKNDLIVYLIELAYNIALSLLDHIPYNPGFE